MKLTFVSLFTLFVTTFSASALAEPTLRKPLRERVTHETKLALETYSQPLTIERKRGSNKAVSFSAMPFAIESQALLVVEVRGRSRDGDSLRFRCIADRNLDQCLGEPLRIEFKGAEEALVLTVTAEAKVSLAGQALVRELNAPVLAKAP